MLLLHGWTATADLNWFTAYASLGEHYRVIALDHHGHGQGIRSKRAFSIEACADDALALCDQLDIDQVIPVGYSMGGPVALSCWQRHPQRVSGLVLGATAPYFSASRARNGATSSACPGWQRCRRATPPRARSWLTEQLYLQRRAQQWEPWAIEQVSRHDWRTILEAGRAIGGFSARDWLDTVDVPVSIIVTMRDEIVPVRRQIKLFDGIRGAEVHRIDGGHDAVVARADVFVPTLLRSIDSVISRAEPTGRRSREAG